MSGNGRPVTWMIATALTAVMTPQATYTQTDAYREIDGTRVLDGSAPRAFGWAILALMAVTFVLAIVAVVLHVTGRKAAAGRTLLVAGIAGLPAIVPGVLALIARQVCQKHG